MSISTPDLLVEQERLLPGASCYVDIGKLQWKPAPWPGIEQKVLMHDSETGMVTVLLRMAPGSCIPLHHHTAIEQTYVLEGSLVDDEGAATAGNFVWRPANGHEHIARAPKGALVLSFLLRPNAYRDNSPHYA